MQVLKAAAGPEIVTLATVILVAVQHLCTLPNSLNVTIVCTWSVYSYYINSRTLMR